MSTILSPTSNPLRGDRAYTPSPFSESEGAPNAPLIFDGIDDERATFRVRSDSVPGRFYVVTIRLDNGNGLCGYWVEAENEDDHDELMEGCGSCRFVTKAGNAFTGLGGCKHQQAVFRAIRAALPDGTKLDPPTFAALLDLQGDL